MWALKHQPPTCCVLQVHLSMYWWKKYSLHPNLWICCCLKDSELKKNRKIKLKSESRSNEMILLLTILTGSMHRIVTLHVYDIVKHYTCQCICSRHTSWLCKSIAVDFLYFQYSKLPPHCHINSCYVQIYIERRSMVSRLLLCLSLVQWR